MLPHCRANNSLRWESVGAPLPSATILFNKSRVLLHDFMGMQRPLCPSGNRQSPSYSRQYSIDYIECIKMLMSLYESFNYSRPCEVAVSKVKVEKMKSQNILCLPKWFILQCFSKTLNESVLEARNCIQQLIRCARSHVYFINLKYSKQIHTYVYMCVYMYVCVYIGMCPLSYYECIKLYVWRWKQILKL